MGRVTRIQAIVLSLCALQGWARGQVLPEYEELAAVWQTEDEVRNSPFHRKRFEDQYAGMIAAGRISDVAWAMVNEFADQDWGDHAKEHRKLVAGVHRFVVAVEIALRHRGIDGPPDELAEQNIFLQELNDMDYGPHSIGMEMAQDDNGMDLPAYFAGTPNEVVLYVWNAAGDDVVYSLTPTEVRRWRLLEDALTNLVTEQIREVSAANKASLQLALRRWENVLDKGYSQMPWESLFNGWLLPPDGPPNFGPPDHQWILLHPTIGIQFSADQIDETRVKETLNVEVLGHVWYTGNELDDFWGVSATLSFREDLDPGIGALVHIKRNWSVGIAWHDVQQDQFAAFPLCHMGCHVDHIIGLFVGLDGTDDVFGIVLRHPMRRSFLVGGSSRWLGGADIRLSDP